MMRLIRAIKAALSGLAGIAVCVAQTPQMPSPWTQPAAELAAQITDILGPGEAQLTVRNLSTIETGEVAGIEKLLEQDLNARGVLISGRESANAIHVTLSENARERLWVADVAEGNERHIAMVHVDGLLAPVPVAEARMVLRKEKIAGLFNRIGGVMHDNAILAAAEINGHFVVMFADRISVFSASVSGWNEVNSFLIEKRLTRDPRGILLPQADGSGFVAFAPGAECTGSYSLPLGGQTADSGWRVRCRGSDDPWPVYQSPDASGVPALRAFYNPARDYFTGVVTPNIGPDLPAFYTASVIPRAGGGAALLTSGIDGKISILENGTLRTVAGTRDWGSDFAVVHSGCGAGTQVIASSSGEAAHDSLRAFQVQGWEATPTSAPLTMDGTVTALWTAQDGKSVLIVVREPAGEYEVDRVTAVCS